MVEKYSKEVWCLEAKVESLDVNWITVRNTVKKSKRDLINLAARMNAKKDGMIYRVARYSPWGEMLKNDGEEKG